MTTTRAGDRKPGLGAEIYAEHLDDKLRGALCLRSRILARCVITTPLSACYLSPSEIQTCFELYLPQYVPFSVRMYGLIAFATLIDLLLPLCLSILDAAVDVPVFLRQFLDHTPRQVKEL